MRFIQPISELKLTRIEALFFLTVFLVFPVITDLEYGFYEPNATLPSSKMYLERLIYGILGMIPYFIYYRIIIPFLFEKRYVTFVSLLFLFLIFLNIYIKCEHWFVGKLLFLPDDMVLSAQKWFSIKAVLFHFSIIFVLRELLMFTALAYFIRSSNQERQMNALKRQQLEMELVNLKIQLQPHFFFNTLNNIYSLALQKSDNTAPLVAKHAEMMRYILYQSTKPIVKLGDEIDFLVNYTEVEALRYSRKINITFDMQALNVAAAIEPLLLLPFVENAFKHGIRQETGAGFVNIIICMIGNEFDMEICNSKVSPNMSNTKGIGLENAVGRLKLLYPDHKLIFNDDPNTFEVRLHLTLTSYV